MPCLRALRVQARRAIQHDWRSRCLITHEGLRRRQRARLLPPLPCLRWTSLVQTFHLFEGSTEFWIDNQKTAVIKHVPGVVHSTLASSSSPTTTTAFAPRPAGPTWRARTKGKVEWMVSYVEDRYFQRHGWTHLDQQLEAWLRGCLATPTGVFSAAYSRSSVIASLGSNLR